MDTQAGIPALAGGDPLSIYPQYSRDLRDALNTGYRLPFLMGAGKETFNMGGSTTTTTDVDYSFVGFTEPPIVIVGNSATGTGRYAASVATVTISTTGCTIHMRDILGGTTNDNVDAYWLAVQMTPTAAGA